MQKKQKVVDVCVMQLVIFLLKVKNNSWTKDRWEPSL